MMREYEKNKGKRRRGKGGGNEMGCGYQSQVGKAESE